MTVVFDGGRYDSECAVVSEEEEKKQPTATGERGQRTNYREEVSGK